MDVAAQAAQLLDCLCVELEDTLGGPVCSCCLYPGPVPMDNCCDCGRGHGQAAVGLAQLYPTTSFPQQTTNISRCPTLTWAAVFELTVYRCAAIVGEDGQPPSCDELAHDAAVVMDDAAAMLRAIGCCFGVDGPCSESVVPGSWTRVGPAGGCVGGLMTVTVDVGVFCCRDRS